MLPLAVMAAPAPEREPARSPETEEYLVSELRRDLELQGAQGIIEEGGRR